MQRHRAAEGEAGYRAKSVCRPRKKAFEYHDVFPLASGVPGLYFHLAVLFGFTNDLLLLAWEEGEVEFLMVWVGYAMVTSDRIVVAGWS